MVDSEPIAEWIAFACEKNGVPELAKKIRVEFNARFTRRMGDAVWDRKRKRGRVRLSTPLWPRATEAERYETVIHEACHVVVGYKHKRRVAPHGSEWRQAMLNCGLKPERTHSVDRTGLARQGKRYTVTACPVNPPEEPCKVGPRHYAKLMTDSDYTLHCSKCGLRVDASAFEG